MQMNVVGFRTESLPGVMRRIFSRKQEIIAEKYAALLVLLCDVSEA